MNPIERVLRRADRVQQRFTPAAFVFGVMKKYGDDAGGVLVTNLTYSGFITLFPLLLIFTTILGLIAASHPTFRAEAIKAVSDQIPLIGQQLTGSVHELQRSSTIGLIVGLLVLVWGATGLAQAGLFAMTAVWNVPGPARPGYFQRLGRAVLFLLLLGGGVIATTFLTVLNAYSNKAAIWVILLQVLTVALNAGMYVGAFRALTPKGVPTGKLLPGSVVGGIAWTLLQILGAYLVHHFLKSASAYGVFATVLGLLAWIYLAVNVTVYAAEVNVVLARRLWPRSIVQPPLTEADRYSIALQALQNQRRPEQQVEVTFDDREPGAPVPLGTPRTPDEVTPPARRRWRRRSKANAANGAAPAEAGDATEANEAKDAPQAKEAGDTTEPNEAKDAPQAKEAGDKAG
jgi:YihY family inner membrane protein